MNQYHETHNSFFKFITKSKLNELLKRADESTSYLAQDINNALNDTGYRSETRISNNCDIIINFYNNHSPKRIGHITFHIYPKDNTLSNKSKMFGRFHIQNSRNRNIKYPFKLNTIKNPDRNLSLIMSINNSIYQPQSLKVCEGAFFQVISKYFDLYSNISLDHKLTNYRYNTHTCLNTITSRFVGKSAIRTTYKKLKL
jgi:hypothetical protein